MSEDIVAMARAAMADERLADGALYGKLADRIDALEAALQHIVRECGALNKGPVAVHLALAALNPRKAAPASTSE